MKTNGVLQFRSQEWYRNRLDKMERQSIVNDFVPPPSKPSSQKKEWKLYREEVRRITQEQDLQSLEHYEKRLTYTLLKEHGYKLYRSESYHTLDHIISIWFGWKNNISPEVIGHITNLRYIPGLENSNKGTKCS